MNKFLRTINTIFSCFIIINATAQDSSGKKDFLSSHLAGFYLGSYYAKGEPLLITPQAWMYFNDIYIEARYNYEEVETASIHIGRSLLFNKDQLEIIPAAGFVFGGYTGLSAGLNINYETEKLSGFTQTQYCFSLNNKNDPFYFSWVGISTPVYKNLQLGASWQWLAQKKVHPSFDYGPMLSFTKGIWGVEAYAYNPWKEDRYWQAAVYIDLANK